MCTPIKESIFLSYRNFKKSVFPGTMYYSEQVKSKNQFVITVLEKDVTKKSSFNETL